MSPPGSNHQHQAVFPLIERQRGRHRERDRSLAKSKFGRPACGRVYERLCVFVQFVFVSLSVCVCACFFAKAEISWLGTIRGDSECKAELFLFVSDISALGHTVSVCFIFFSHPADLSPEIFCQAFVLIPVHQ